jgi:hypothetical protein
MSPEEPDVADQTLPISDAALKRSQAIAKTYATKSASIVDQIIAERRAEAAGNNGESASEPAGARTPTVKDLPRKPLRRASLKPDPVAEHKREWPQACVETLRANLLSFGIEASDDAIFAAWERHSDSFCAGWISIYDNAEQNVRALVAHFDFDT